jgi:peptidoglycan-N-acetylglucosamine deacetylase
VHNNGMIQGLVLAGAVLIAICLFVFWGEPLAILCVLERITPNIVYRVRTNLPIVALSFDDGPHPAFTPQVLEILKHHDAKATFFLIGERAMRHPDMVDRISVSGHEIANHYFTNGSCVTHSDTEFRHFMRQTERAVESAQRPRLFRPPGGIARPRQLRLAREHGYTCVLGSAYPHDPLHPPEWYMKWLIEKNLVPGTIVILHDGIQNPTRSIRALPSILEAGRRKGLRFVCISELVRLSQNNKEDH